MSMQFRIEIKAEGEVRDKDGNLLSKTDATGSVDVTEAQLVEMGLPVPPTRNKEKEA